MEGSDMQTVRFSSKATVFVTCLLWLSGCSRSGAAAPARKGGTVNGVVFQRIGKVVAGNQDASSDHPDSIDERPIVLWRGSTPAAVLYYRVHTHAPGVTWEQRIERFDSLPGESWLGRRRGPFPIVFGAASSITGKRLDDADAFDMLRIVTADVDGDGVEELLLPRSNGAIGVYGVDKVLFEQPALPAPKNMRYRVQNSTTVKLKGRDVVFFVLQLESKGDRSAYHQSEVAQFAILRVDHQGVSRFALPDTSAPITMLHAIGAINRPGSNDLDEILVLFRTKASESEMYLSRQRADGRSIAPVKEVYADIDFSSLRFMFLPETSTAILADGNSHHIYFLRPEKPMNWIADVDLTALSESSRSLQILYPFDRGTAPKVVFAVDDTEEGHPTRHSLYAMDASGKAFRPSPNQKAWQPMTKPAPFLRLTAPSSDHRFAGMLAEPGAEIVLAVYSRPAMMKQLTEDEIMAAGEKYVQPELLQERRHHFLDFGVEELKDIPTYADEERRKESVIQKIRTVEEWKRILPESYAKILKLQKIQYFVCIEGILNSGFEYAFTPERYRNIDEYKRWLDGLKLGPETAFEVACAGTTVERFGVVGHLPSQLEKSTTGFPFDFRASALATSVVLPIDIASSVADENRTLGFFIAASPTKGYQCPAFTPTGSSR
jgi:hypothetical protein